SIKRLWNLFPFLWPRRRVLYVWGEIRGHLFVRHIDALCIYALNCIAKVILRRCVDQDHSHYILWIAALIGTDEKAADRMTYKNVRRVNTGGLQQKVQVIHRLSNAIYCRSRVAPRKSGTIVCTNTGKL